MIPVRTLILEHVTAVWRWRWYAAAVAWLVCVAGWAYVAMLPNTYQAKTRIYVDTDTMLRPLLRGLAMDSNILNEIDLMQRTLLSRPNLQKVARMADLDLGVRSPGEQDALITELQRKIGIYGQGRSLFELRYEGTNPERSKKVIQSLLDIFVEANLGNSRKDMIAARTFLDEQIREYEKQLEEAERRMADFKAKNLGFLPGDHNVVTRLETARGELARTQGELSEVRKRRDEMKKQLSDIPRMIEQVNAGPMGPDLGPPIGGGIGGDPLLRVPELEQKLKALLLRYTERHPDVIEAKRLLELAKQEEKERSAKEAAGVPVPQAPNTVKTTVSNPVYEQLKLQLVQIETLVASLENRLERNVAEVTRWERMGRSAPNVAADMARLDRDYSIIKRNYEELLSRREAARMGQDLETQTKGVQFRLIDPPEVSPRPTGPNRPLFVSIAFAAGLGAGLVFAFFMSQLDQTMRHVDQLRTTFMLPVLGGVSLIRSAFEMRRRRFELISFSFVCVCLVGAFLGLLSIEAFLSRNV